MGLQHLEKGVNWRILSDRKWEHRFCMLWNRKWEQCVERIAITFKFGFVFFLQCYSMKRNCCVALNQCVKLNQLSIWWVQYCSAGKGKEGMNSILNYLFWFRQMTVKEGFLRKTLENVSRFGGFFILRNYQKICRPYWNCCVKRSLKSSRQAADFVHTPVKSFTPSLQAGKLPHQYKTVQKAVCYKPKYHFVKNMSHSYIQCIQQCYEDFFFKLISTTMFQWTTLSTLSFAVLIVQH